MAKRLILWCVGAVLLVLLCALFLFLLTREPGVTGNGLRFVSGRLVCRVTTASGARAARCTAARPQACRQTARCGSRAMTATGKTGSRDGYGTV